jgi:hypothetical protein
MISESPTEQPSWFLRHHPELLLDFQGLPQGEAVGGLISEKDFFLFACRLLDRAASERNPGILPGRR